MRFYSHAKFLIIFLCLIFLTGCSSELKKAEPDFRFVNLQQESWSELARNMYKIQLSMRKIDSLSADLNLRFTKINALGL
jgi:hypothetical protein